MADFLPEGVCARKITFSVDDQGCVRDVAFVQGCPGNAVGVARLAEGRQAAEIIQLLEDVTCGNKESSCPAQLAKALREYQESSN